MSFLQRRPSTVKPPAREEKTPYPNELGKRNSSVADVFVTNNPRQLTGKVQIYTPVAASPQVLTPRGGSWKERENWWSCWLQQLAVTDLKQGKREFETMGSWRLGF
ncbi:unnamed protein product [Linum trigynum]|uniref:Uncharacterized protein n=1 Tax=Linum trigynum TaxID=586398 RepID=A0AAV2EYH5_9ROSI